MKLTKRILSFILVLCLALAMMTACGDPKVDAPKENYDYKGKNLIYIIGDGMGFNHIENTKLGTDIDKFCFEDNYVGDVTTRSANKDITDSAASATALATGVKTNNDYIGVNSRMEALENIMELSKKYGRKTGIVTTDILSGATPAGFSAHANHRKYTSRIIESQAVGAVDLLMGKYDSDYNENKDLFTDNGFAYTESYAELKELSKDSKIVANLMDIDTNYIPANDDAVPLKTLVEYALDYLTTNNDRAFTLMVEGAYIDKHSHERDIARMMAAMLELEETVEYILEWAEGRDDTVIIFTADHETGMLDLADNKEGIVNSLYGSPNHSAENVPLYLFNVATELTSFDNTDVHRIAKSVVTGKKE